MWVADMRKKSEAQTALRIMFHVVMPCGPSGDFKKATRVASVPTAEAAWGYLDDVRVRLASLNVPLGIIELVVVDEGREPVPRPNNNDSVVVLGHARGRQGAHQVGSER